MNSLRRILLKLEVQFITRAPRSAKFAGQNEWFFFCFILFCKFWMFSQVLPLPDSILSAASQLTWVGQNIGWLVCCELLANSLSIKAARVFHSKLARWIHINTSMRQHFHFHKGWS